ncbi:carnosine synthase 1-like isoform X2 [Mya arenaria]|uniref:carnosine synthase 1-like isoform X2 n=1 Tax=Mya arenaria TaxID=6604 RepID=UPI0022E1EFA4|nr:carnosine synthase 1-like isoform X2 [Mya arenaria]
MEGIKIENRDVGEHEGGGDTDGTMMDQLKDLCDSYNVEIDSSLWDTDVDLGPPSSLNVKIPKEDATIMTEYNHLQQSLYETGFPETVNRLGSRPSKLNKENICVAFLHIHYESLGMLLEGGRQLPGGFHMILSTSWLTKEPSKDQNGLFSLFVHKAITFHSGGVTKLEEFVKPRRVTYLVNYFTDVCTRAERNDGPELERGLDCPMSSSVALCEQTDNKVWTRNAMAAAGVDIPVTLAFCYNNTHKVSTPNPKIVVFNIENNDCCDFADKEIRRFLASDEMKGVKRVVVKPSGRMYCGSVGVNLLQVDDVHNILNHAKKLLAEIEPGSSVLVEECIEHLSPRPGNKNERRWMAEEGMGFRCRVIVSRDHDNKAVCVPIICGIASADGPINGHNTTTLTLMTTLQSFNVGVEEIFKFEHELRYRSERYMNAIIEYEETLSPEERGELYAQTDLIGIDYVITERNGKLAAVAIEVNSHDCMYVCQIFDNTMAMGCKQVAETMPVDEIMTYLQGEPDLEDFEFWKTSSYSRHNHGAVHGRTVRPYIRNAIARSQKWLIRGKQILVVGAGGFSKSHIWADTAKYGIHLVMVDSNSHEFAQEYGQTYIHYDFTDHTKDEFHAIQILNIIKRMGIKVAGCLTFLEDCVPLSAMIREHVGLRGSNTEACLIAKRKSQTQNCLVEKTGMKSHFITTDLYASKAYLITKPSDIDEICSSMTFPAMLKLEHGSSAVGVSLVKNKDELQKKYAETTSLLQSEEDFHGIGLGFGNEMFAMESHEGSEHDIDIVIFDRKLVAAFISDKGPTNIPSFIETASIMPSCLPLDKQSQLIVAAFQCCLDIGLSDGVYNVKMTMTSCGPKLIELNGRMGGFYNRDWIKRLYGCDLVLYSYLIACGIKPHAPKHKPQELLMGIMLVPSHHRHILDDESIRKEILARDSNGDIMFRQFVANADDAMYNANIEEPFANVAVNANSYSEGKKKLMKFCNQYKIDNENYDVVRFIECFWDIVVRQT